MTPERLEAVVVRWVRWYVRDLPAPVAERRVDEIRSDVHDQIDHERNGGATDRQVVRAIVSRTLRGLLADASWRRGQRRRLTPEEDAVRVHRTLARPAARVLLGVALVLALPATATATGAADWSVGDFLLAGVLLALVGATVALAVRSAGSVAGAAVVAALGVAAAFAGQADDAPGLVLVGGLLVASAGVLAVRVVGRTR